MTTNEYLQTRFSNILACGDVAAPDQCRHWAAIKGQGRGLRNDNLWRCDLDRAIADGEAEGWVKVLTVPGKDKILGVTIVGQHAGDILAEYVLEMGLGLNRILSTIHICPTLAEANKNGAGEWQRAHKPERLLSWVASFHAWRRG